MWGTGTPRREFLHADDLGSAAVHLLDHYDASGPINVGTGKDLPIRELAELVAEVTGFRGRIVQDPTRPDGTPRKLLDVSRIRESGWAPTIGLHEGVASTYAWYVANEHQLAAR